MAAIAKKSKQKNETSISLPTVDESAKTVQEDLILQNRLAEQK
jgi:hypothetical protein